MLGRDELPLQSLRDHESRNELIPDVPVEGFANEIGVSAVARVLLDHVDVDPSKVDGPVGRSCGHVNKIPGGCLLTRASHLRHEHLVDVRYREGAEIIEIGVGVSG